jgi:hypothetical protein
MSAIAPHEPNCDIEGTIAKLWPTPESARTHATPNTEPGRPYSPRRDIFARSILNKPFPNLKRIFIARLYLANILDTDEQISLYLGLSIRLVGLFSRSQKHDPSSAHQPGLIGRYSRPFPRWTSNAALPPTCLSCSASCPIVATGVSLTDSTMSPGLSPSLAARPVAC